MGKVERRRCIVGAEAAEAFFDFLHEGVVIDAACSRHDHAIGAVLLVHILAQIGGGERHHRLRFAENGAPDRLMAVSCFGETVENNIVGRVVRRADLLHDDLFFAFQFSFVELGGSQDIGEDIDGERHVIAQNARIIGRGLDAGGGIDFAANIFDIRCYLPGSTVFSSLECHMLKKMSNAMPVGSFVSRTGLDPNSKRHAFHVGHRIGGYRQSIGKTRYFNTHKQTAPCIPALVLVSEPVFLSSRMAANVFFHDFQVVVKNCEAFFSFHQV